MGKTTVGIHDNFSSLAKRDIHWLQKLLLSRGLQHPFSFSDFISMASHHTDLVQSLLDDPRTHQLLAPNQLVALCTNNRQAALRCVCEARFYEQLSNIHLTQLGVLFPEVRQALIDNNLMERIDGEHLAKLGSADSKLADDIYCYSPWFNKINQHEYGLLSKINFDLASKLFKQLLEKDIGGAVNIGKYHPELAEELLSHHGTRVKLSREQIITLASAHERSAMLVFQSEQLMAACESIGWAQIANEQINFAKALLKHRKYMQQMDGESLVQLCKNKPKLAAFYYNQAASNKALKEKLQGFEGGLACTSVQVAKQFIINPKTDSSTLIRLCQAHPILINIVLRQVKRIKYFNGEDLVSLCLVNPDAFHYIEKMPKLRDKVLSASNFHELCHRYVSIMQRCHQDKAYRVSLSSEHISELDMALKALELVFAHVDLVMHAKRTHETNPYAQSNSLLTPMYKFGRDKQEPVELVETAENKIKQHLIT